MTALFWMENVKANTYILSKDKIYHLNGSQILYSKYFYKKLIVPLSRFNF